MGTYISHLSNKTRSFSHCAKQSTKQQNSKTNNQDFALHRRKIQCIHFHITVSIPITWNMCMYISYKDENHPFPYFMNNRSQSKYHCYAWQFWKKLNTLERKYIKNYFSSSCSLLSWCKNEQNSLTAEENIGVTKRELRLIRINPK